MAQVALKRDLEDYNSLIDEYNKQAGKYTRAGKVYNEGVANYNTSINAYNDSFMKGSSGQLAIFRLRDLKKFPGKRSTLLRAPAKQLTLDIEILTL